MKSFDELLALIVQRGVHAVYGEYGDGWGIEHNPDELARFLVDMQTLGVESVLEVGTNWKAGLSRFLHDEMGWQVTSVDTHDYGHAIDGITFVKPGFFPDTLLGDPRGVFDLALLTAEHSYNGASADDQLYRRRATKGVAFHNIAGLRECEGVRDYWREIAYLPGWREDNGDPLKTGWREDNGDPLKTGYHEIVAHGDKRGGIGYIVLSEVQREPEQLLSPETLAKLRASDLFKEEKLPVKKAPAKRAGKPRAKAKA